MRLKQPIIFWGNERVSHQAIIAQARQETVQRLKGMEQVLLVQDMVSFNFSHHPGMTGLGPLENQYTSGFLAHNTLAVSIAGVPLGLVERHVWARNTEQTGLRHQRHERGFADKESCKWVEGLPDEFQPIIVCDAEAHIYEFLDVLHARGHSTGVSMFQAFEVYCTPFLPRPKGRDFSAFFRGARLCGIRCA
jgi:hypothetical protein